VPTPFFYLLFPNQTEFSQRGNVLTALSIDNRLKQGLALRGMPVDQFCVVATKENISKASKSILFSAFRGVRALENENALKLWALWQEIEAMCHRFEPFALDLKSGEQVWSWLNDLRSGAIYTLVIRGKDEVSDDKQ
jgi:hypothetical protein